MTATRALLWLPLATALALNPPTLSQAAAAPSAESAKVVSGLHDFDFEFGEWRVHHRIKRPGGEWVEFDGTCRDRPLIDGSSNVEEHRFDRPTGVTHGIALRAYDAKSGQWAIWWVDSRDPHGTLDPPMKGRFEDGVGTFYADGLVNGTPTRTRFLWSHSGTTSARWEQAGSTDGGATWDTNWVMEFERQNAASAPPPR